MPTNCCHKFILIFAFLFAGVFFFSSSCRRNKDCDVKIIVMNGNNSTPVSGATVNIHPPVPGTNLDPDKTKTNTTDGAGEAKFTFKLPGKLQADVIPPTTSTLTSNGAQVDLEAVDFFSNRRYLAALLARECNRCVLPQGHRRRIVRARSRCLAGERPRQLISQHCLLLPRVQHYKARARCRRLSTWSVQKGRVVPAGTGESSCCT